MLFVPALKKLTKIGKTVYDGFFSDMSKDIRIFQRMHMAVSIVVRIEETKAVTPFRIYITSIPLQYVFVNRRWHF